MHITIHLIDLNHHSHFTFQLSSHSHTSAQSHSIHMSQSSFHFASYFVRFVQHFLLLFYSSVESRVKILDGVNLRLLTNTNEKAPNDDNQNQFSQHIIILYTSTHVNRSHLSTPILKSKSI